MSVLFLCSYQGANYRSDSRDSQMQADYRRQDNPPDSSSRSNFAPWLELAEMVAEMIQAEQVDLIVPAKVLLSTEQKVLHL